MLILTRRVGETVMIGNDVTVTVLGVKGNQVRVGVNAPREWQFIAKRSSNASSAKSRRALGRPAEHAKANGTNGAALISGSGPDFGPPAPRFQVCRDRPCGFTPRRARFILPRSQSPPERWPSGRRRTPAKGVRVKSPSRVRIPLSPPVFSIAQRDFFTRAKASQRISREMPNPAANSRRIALVRNA